MKLLILYPSAYLCGFCAQAADVPPDVYEKEAAATAVRMFMDEIKEKNEMDSVEITGDIQHSVRVLAAAELPSEKDPAPRSQYHDH